MTFDPKQHVDNQTLINAARKIRPDEKDISKLLKIGSEALGRPAKMFSTRSVRKAPPISETGPFFKCQQCNLDQLYIEPLCPSCHASENGKYRTRLTCKACGYTERSDKFIVQQYAARGYDFKSHFKKITVDPHTHEQEAP